MWEDHNKDYLLTGLVEIHFIEVEKFEALERKDLKGDKLQRWLTFFKADLSQEKLEELMEMDQDIKRAEERLEYLSSDPETLALYKVREASLHERANMISGAKEEGKKESQIAIAINLLSLGMDLETISQATGLSIEEIEKLKETRH